MIGILNESDEWSSHQLQREIEKSGIPCVLIDTEKPIDPALLLNCRLVVSRVFASGAFREHQTSLAQMPEVMAFLKANAIPMINPYGAHRYEVDKSLATALLRANGLPVPEVYSVFTPQDSPAPQVRFPCVLKPNCGGRTTYTAIVQNEKELAAFVATLPKIEMIAQEYIPTTFGFVTRIELIGGICRLILQRSIAENGLSTYHLGSTYSFYPDCSFAVRQAAERAAALAEIECGSLDIIENENGFWIIDVNAVSNVSPDNTMMFYFDLMQQTAQYIVREYKKGR